ncbi:hypothetical protein BRC73_02245 [Halobacteriales archaeon QH_7_66_37]|nr:MAG: hypothetical protein BRC73_02245 [Halobacteriales archaeon QH_7_66_37]
MSESSDPDDSGADARAPDVGTVEAESDAPVVDFQWFALPWWLLYVVVFVGVVVYTRVTPSWRRPYKRQEP